MWAPAPDGTLEPVFLGAVAHDADGNTLTEESCIQLGNEVDMRYHQLQADGTMPAELKYVLACTEVEVNPKAGSI